MKKLLFYLLLIFTAVQAQAQLINSRYYNELGSYNQNRGITLDSNANLPRIIPKYGFRTGAIMYDSIAKSARIFDGITWIYQRGVDSIWIDNGGSDPDTLRYRMMGSTYIAGLMTGGGGSMIYPGAGIPVSTGSAWGTSITDNSGNWNTAFGWGNHAGLYPTITRFIDSLNALRSSINLKLNISDVQHFANTNLTLTGNRAHNGLGLYSVQLANLTLFKIYTLGDSSVFLVQNSGNSLLNRDKFNVIRSYSQRSSKNSNVYTDTTVAKMWRDSAGIVKTEIALTDEEIIHAIGTDTLMRIKGDSIKLKIKNNAALDSVLRLSSTGKLEQAPTNVSEFTSLANKDLMWYNSSTGRWNNLTPAALKSELAIVMLINGASNVGSGAQVFKDTSSNKINLRSIVAGTGISVTQNTNDIVIATTITANADSTAARIKRGTYAQRPATPDTGQIFWQTDGLEGKYEYDGSKWNFAGIASKYIINDEFGYGGTNPGVGHTATVSGTGSSADKTSYTDTLNNIGVAGEWKLQTGTTSTGYAWIRANNAGEGSMDSMTIYNEQYVRIPVLSDGTDRFRIQVGINATNGTTAPHQMVFEYTDNVNSGNWSTRTTAGAGGNSTLKDAGVAVTTGWVKLGVKSINTRSGGIYRAEFYINDILVTTHTTTSQITAVPDYMPGTYGLASSIYYSTMAIVKTAGTTNRYALIDYSFTYKIRSK